MPARPRSNPPETRNRNNEKVIDPPAAEAAAADNKRKKTGRYIPNGIAFIHATFNNTKVAFTDLHGNVIAWSSSGKNGFKGSRKSTAYAAQVVAADAAKKAQAFGMKDVEVRIKGPGAGRESASRTTAAVPRSAAATDGSSVILTMPDPRLSSLTPNR